jgi:tetratricopeptide (TPR) repeat protein
MKLVLIFVVAAGAACAQSDAPAQAKKDLAAERQQVIALMNQAQTLKALPLVEDLAAADPDDGMVEYWLADCLLAKARHGATAEEAPALLQRARAAALRARELANKSPLLNDLIQILNNPETALNQTYSANAEASAKVREGEQAFAAGDYDAALAAYRAALKLDPELYGAALFAGDVCFRRQDLSCAAEWFSKAIAIDPAHETAYRYWGGYVDGRGQDAGSPRTVYRSGDRPAVTEALGRAGAMGTKEQLPVARAEDRSAAGQYG